MDKHEVKLTTGQRALLSQAPSEWTDVPRFAHVSQTLQELKDKGCIEMQDVPSITPGVHKRQWRISPTFERRRNYKANGND